MYRVINGEEGNVRLGGDLIARVSERAEGDIRFAPVAGDIGFLHGAVSFLNHFVRNLVSDSASETPRMRYYFAYFPHP